MNEKTAIDRNCRGRMKQPEKVLRLPGHQTEGIMTVEAALLLLPILGCIVWVLFCAFFLHDRCVLTSVAYETAVWGSEQERISTHATDSEISGAAELIGEGKCRFFRETGYEGAADTGNVTVTASGGDSLEESFSSSLLFGQIFRGEQVQMNCRKTKTETQIRRARWLMHRRKE